jgi:hypothetical protein
MAFSHKLTSISLVAAFFLTGIHLFAAGEGEAATGSEMERVPISLLYRGYDPTYWDQDMVANDRIWQYFEEKFNIDFEMAYGGGGGEYVVASMAAGTAPDLVMVWPGHPWLGLPTWQGWIQDGLLVNLNDLVAAQPDRYPILHGIFQDPVYRLYNVVQNGGADNYHAVMTGNRFKPITDSAIVYNGVMLDQLGLEVPETYDEQIHAMRQARDQLGATGFGWPTYKGTHWKGINYLYFQTQGLDVGFDGPGAGYAQDANGEWYDAAIDPRNQVIWQTIQQHGAEQLLYPGWLTGELFDHIDQMAAGKHLSGMYKGPRPDSYMQFFERFTAANPDATLADFPQTLHPISGPGGRAHDNAVPLGVYRAIAIPVFSEHPDRALDVMEWWLSEEGQTIRWFGLKGIHYTEDDHSDFDADEFFKDIQGQGHQGMTAAEFMEADAGEFLWYPGAATSNYDDGIVPYKEFGNWFEAQQNVRDVRTERINAALAVPKGVSCEAPHAAIWEGGGCEACSGANPPVWCQFQAANEVWSTFLAEGWEGLPQYLDMVALSAEELQIQAALTDIKNKWWVAFVLGNKDVMADWDDYVAEYEAAGGSMLFESWSAQVAEAKATWDSVQ